MKSAVKIIIFSYFAFELLLIANAACTNREKNEDEKVSEFLEDVKCHLSTGVDKVKDGASKAGSSIKEGAKSAGESIKEGASKVYGVLKTGVSKAADVVSGSFNYLKKAVTPSKSEAVQDVEDTKPIWTDPIWDDLPVVGDIRADVKEMKS